MNTQRTKVTTPKRLPGRHAAVDFGSWYVSVYVAHDGMVFFEPSLVAVRRDIGRVVGVGNEASRRYGRTPDGICLLHPIARGAVAHPEEFESMLRCIIRSVATPPRRSVARLVITMHRAMTDADRHSVQKIGQRAGARKVFFVDHAIASALGVGIDMKAATAHAVVDFGAGSTTAAVIRNGRTEMVKCLQTGGIDLDAAIADWLKRAHGIAVPEQALEHIKIAIGSVVPLEDETDLEVRGRNAQGKPMNVHVSFQDVRTAMATVVQSMVEAIVALLSGCPDDIRRDLAKTGVVTVGCGALLRGIDFLVSERTGLPTHMAGDPLTSTVHGAGMLLEQPALFAQYATVI